MSLKRGFCYFLSSLYLCGMVSDIHADVLGDLKTLYQCADNTVNWLTEVVNKSETLVIHAYECKDVSAEDLFQLSEESDMYASALYTLIKGYSSSEQRNFFRQKLNKVSRALLLLAKGKAQEELNTEILKQTNDEFAILLQDGILEEDIVSDIELMSSDSSTSRSDYSDGL